VLSRKHQQSQRLLGDQGHKENEKDSGDKPCALNRVGDADDSTTNDGIYQIRSRAGQTGLVLAVFELLRRDGPAAGGALLDNHDGVVGAGSEEGGFGGRDHGCCG